MKKKSNKTQPILEFYSQKDNPDIKTMKQEFVKEVIEAIEIRRKLIKPESFKPKGSNQKN